MPLALGKRRPKSIHWNTCEICYITDVLFKPAIPLHKRTSCCYTASRHEYIKLLNRLETLGMWVLPWIYHMTNNEVLRLFTRYRELFEIYKRSNTWAGPYLPQYQIRISKINNDAMEGKRDRGRKKYSWLNNTIDWTGLDALALFRAA